MQTIGAAREEGIDIDVVNTPYLNTIHPSQQPAYPGDLEMGKAYSRDYFLECNDDGH